MSYLTTIITIFDHHILDEDFVTCLVSILIEEFHQLIEWIDLCYQWDQFFTERLVRCMERKS